MLANARCQTRRPRPRRTAAGCPPPLPYRHGWCVILEDGRLDPDEVFPILTCSPGGEVVPHLAEALEHIFALLRARARKGREALVGIFYKEG